MNTPFNIFSPWNYPVLQHPVHFQLQFDQPQGCGFIILKDRATWKHHPSQAMSGIKKHSCFVAHQNSSSLFTQLECMNCLDAFQGTSLTNVSHKKFIEQVKMGTLVFFAYFSFTYPPVQPVFPVTCQIWMTSVTTNIRRDLSLSLWLSHCGE